MKQRDALTDLRNKSVTDLVAQLHDEEKKLVELRFSLAFRKLSNYRALRQAKKTIARVQTLIREKTAQALAKSTKESQ